MDTAIEELIDLKDVKSPKGNFILGNLMQFNKKDKHRVLEEWAKECGELYAIKLITKRILVSTNTDINATILKERPHKFSRFSKIDEIFQEMGIFSVFNAEGEHWAKQRKPVSEALSVKKVRGYYPIIHQKTTNLIDKIESYANADNSVEILKDLIAFTIDVTTEVAFGYKLNTLKNEEDSFQEHLELIFPSINERITAPLATWRFLPSAKDRKLISSLKAIQGVIAKFILTAKEDLEKNPALKEAPVNFLQALLVESEKEDTVFNEKTLYGNVVAMLIAGEDTTANTLGWALFYLAQNPEMVVRVRKEANKVYPKLVAPKRYEQLANLKFTNAVVQEAIRLKPTTPVMMFEPNEDVVVKNVKVPKGTMVIVQNGSGSMQEDNFSSPTVFDPTRWIKAECPYKKHEPKASKAFGGGPRLCPGMHLSIIEMTAAISSICKQFDISLAVKPEEVKENFAFTVSPENLKVIFKKPSN